MASWGPSLRPPRGPIPPACKRRRAARRHAAVGSCWLGLELWKRLGLDRFFQQQLDGEPAEVAWSRVAAVLVIHRLCAPGSELAIEQRWYPSTALDALLGIESGKLNDTRLHPCLDRILPHKTKLERHLKERYGELFEAEFDVLLYDLTSTCVEGAAEQGSSARVGARAGHRDGPRGAAAGCLAGGKRPQASIALRGSAGAASSSRLLARRAA